MKKLHPITDVLQKNKPIHNLSLHSQRLNQINLVLQQILPADFISRCHLANIRDNSIILQTDSASIANLLRFQADSICQQISTQCQLNISQLKIKVRPLTTLQQSKAKSTRHAIAISADNIAIISATAETINDPALKNALTKLAKRVKNS